MRPHVYIENRQGATGAVILLPGRGQYGYSLLRQYSREYSWEGVMLMSVQPPLEDGWYPPPVSPADQSEAAAGVDRAADHLERIIARLPVPRDKVVVAGFSMGGVVAVRWACRTAKPIGAVVCHSGAILEPSRVRRARHRMPIVLNHALDDCCFDWKERYLPMKESLIRNDYNVTFHERATGNHTVMRLDIRRLRGLFQGIFGRDLSWQPVWPV